MPSVVLRDGESQQQLLRRFRKRVIRSGVLGAVRKKRWFISRTEKRRMDRKKAIRRLKRREQKYTQYRR